VPGAKNDNAHFKNSYEHKSQGRYLHKRKRKKINKQVEDTVTLRQMVGVSVPSMVVMDGHGVFKSSNHACSIRKVLHISTSKLYKLNKVA
jgi:hypothetical protein